MGITLISMGLFQKLFGQKRTKSLIADQPATAEGNKEEWEFYFSNVDGKLSSLFVDLGLHSIAPMKDKSNVVWISVRMNAPRQDGLSSSEESPMLTEIEDHLVGKIKSGFNSIYAGRLTSDGHRDFYFYLGDTTHYKRAFSEVMVAYPKYHFDYGSKGDKEWRGYFDFLYPSPQQFESIQNRHVVEQLEKNGDRLTKPREVDHWIYFRSDNDRATFLTRIKADGFAIVDKDQDKKLGEFSFRLHIKRVDKVDLKSVETYVINLWKLAIECNGEYDGWETSVEKD